MEIPIYATDQLFLAKDYKDLVVVYRNGAPVRLSDLGRVIDANEDVRNFGIVERQSDGADLDQPAAERKHYRHRGAIKALLPQFKARCRPRSFHNRHDRTITIRASIPTLSATDGSPSAW